MSKSFRFALEQAINHQPPSTRPETSIREALTQMQAAASSYIVVTRSSREFVSVFTERDLVNAIATHPCSPETSLVAVSSAEPVTACMAQIPDLLAVRALLQRHQIRHLPIVDDQRHLVGMITHDNLSRLLNPVDLLRLRRVSEVMTSQIIWASPEATFVQLTNLMSCHRVSCVVIGESVKTSDRLKPLGFVTERDIIRAWGSDRSVEQRQAQNIMSTPPRCILPTDTLWQAHDLMKSHQIRRLAVVDAEGFLLGILAQTSLLQRVDPSEAHLTLETLAHVIDHHTADLDEANQKLQRGVRERQRAKKALQQQLARERSMNRITQRIRQSLELETILETAVAEMSECLQVDGTLIYQVANQPNQMGRIVAEMVANDNPKVQGNKGMEAILAQFDTRFYAKGRIHSVPDLQAADHSSRKARFLRYLGVRATCIAPIQVKERLWGLLILNHQMPRHWQKSEINLITQVAAQVGLAIQQATLYAQLEVVNRKLQHQATVDGLTRLFNRHRFDHTLHKEWRRMLREKQPLSLIMCDVDHFKIYNDTYGHPAGDACLQAVARAMMQVPKRPGDEVARYGGEEFAVVLPNTSLEGACHLAEQIRAKVEALQMVHSGSKVGKWVTLSLGVASCVPSAQTTPGGLIKAADQALYAAKANGRNQWKHQAYSVAPAKVGG
ncbi:MAG: diguanylate cyclase [Cyanobacteria bacterium J06638_28]